MECLFLEHVGRWVRPGGVLVMVAHTITSTTARCKRASVCYSRRSGALDLLWERPRRIPSRGCCSRTGCVADFMMVTCCGDARAWFTCSVILAMPEHSCTAGIEVGRSQTEVGDARTECRKSSGTRFLRMPIQAKSLGKNSKRIFAG
jgi:hypothetical protein